MGSETKRRSSSVPGRSLSLVPTLSASEAGGPKPENRIIINVGGVRYETFKSTLKNIPDTRLSWITETTAHTADYDPETKEYFFDRHPGVFNMILNYYRTGKLHAPTDVCGPLFEEELTFWGIDEKQIEACCWMGYSTHRDAQETLAELDDGGNEEDSDDEDVNEIAKRFGIMEDESGPQLNWWEKWQPRIWSLLEEPYSSKGAQVMAFISILFVLLSIIVFTLETHLLFRLPLNDTITIDYDWTVAQIDQYTYPQPALDYLDYVCVAYFTLEFIVRLVFSPRKLAFFTSILNWVDLISIVPFYVEKTLRATGTESNAYAFFKTIRLVRIFRIFKLTRHFQGLKILGHTIKASAKEMLLLVMFLVIFILIFACLVYLAESTDEHDLNYFKNIPIGLWWACVTMTTLGYGDIYPRTVLGYLVGALCAVAGVLVLALPVPVIVNNFALYYGHAQARMKLPKKRRRVLVGAADALKTQIGMPGESFAEQGRSASPAISEELLKDPAQKPEHKNSLDSIGTSSDDSGIRAGDADSYITSSGSSGGISIVFTDETDLSDSSPINKDRTISPTDDMHGRLDSYKLSTSGNGSMDGGASRRRSLRTSDGIALNVNSLLKTPHQASRKDSVSSQRTLLVSHTGSTTRAAVNRRHSLKPFELSQVDT